MSKRDEMTRPEQIDHLSYLIEDAFYAGRFQEDTRDNSKDFRRAAICVLDHFGKLEDEKIDDPLCPQPTPAPAETPSVEEIAPGVRVVHGVESVFVKRGPGQNGPPKAGSERPAGESTESVSDDVPRVLPDGRKTCGKCDHLKPAPFSRGLSHCDVTLDILNDDRTCLPMRSKGCPKERPAGERWEVLDKEGYPLVEIGDGKPQVWADRASAEVVAKAIGGRVRPAGEAKSRALTCEDVGCDCATRAQRLPEAPPEVTTVEFSHLDAFIASNQQWPYRWGAIAAATSDIRANLARQAEAHAREMAELRRQLATEFQAQDAIWRGREADIKAKLAETEERDGTQEP